MIGRGSLAVPVYCNKGNTSVTCSSLYIPNALLSGGHVMSDAKGRV